MINSEIIENGMGNSGTGMPIFHKQPPIATKKAVLRDLQNDTNNFIHSREETLPFVEGKPIANATKLGGTKRPTPEYPSTNHCPRQFPNNGINNHFTYARKKIETEPGNGRIQDNTEKYAVGPQLGYFCQMQREVPQKQMRPRESTIANHIPFMTFSYGAPSVPISLDKPGNGLVPVEHDCLKVTTEVPCSIDPKGADNQLRKERFGSLQNYLKNYNEFDKRDYTQSKLLLCGSDA